MHAIEPMPGVEFASWDPRWLDELVPMWRELADVKYAWRREA